MCYNTLIAHPFVFEYFGAAMKSKRSKNSRPAYSLIFAFVIMTVIMLIATTTIKNTNEKLAYYRDMEGPVKAKLAAESAAENGIGQIRGANAGFEPPYESGSFSEDADGDGIYETYGDYTVYSKAQRLDGSGADTWYTPIPGTGTAGDPDDCSIMNDDEGEDHPCNWNKLMYGDSVTIPLYTDDGYGNILTAADFSSFDDWQLRVRTPCADGSVDNETCTRFVMNESDSSGTFADGTSTSGDSVVFWQLVGEDSAGVVSLMPVDTSTGGTFGSIVRHPDLNTEIYESKINDASDYVVLETADGLTDPYTEVYNTCMDPDLTTLSLQLNIVTPLQKYGTGDSIPYLEWQLITHASEPFGDTKAVIVGEGYHQGTDGIFYFPYLVTRSTTGENTGVYTLSN